MSRKVFAAVLFVGLLLASWVWWTSQTPLPATAPAVSPDSPIVSDSHPALPMKTAVHPITPPTAPIQKPAASSGAQKAVPKTAASPRVKPAAPAVPPPHVPVPLTPAVPPPPPPPPPMIWQGNDTSVTHSGEVTIRNDRQWIQFWAEHHPHEAAPDVDFTQSMVIGVFSGSRPADQFTIRIADIRLLPDRLAVDYQEQLPPPGTFAVNVTVYPYQIKVIPRTALPVKFNKLAPINPNR